jgi:hypothetical protein
MKAWIAQFATGIQAFLSFVSLVAIGIYVNLITSSPERTSALLKVNLGDFFRLSGNVTVFLLVAIACFVATVLLTNSFSRDRKLVVKQFLEALARALIFPQTDSNLAIRATCRIYNKKKQHLETYAFYGDPADADPFQPIPTDGERSKPFSIVKALKEKRIVASDIPPGAKYPDDIRVWKRIRSVLAAPLRDYDEFGPQGEVLGTISFDSSKPLTALHFDKEGAREICRISASCIYRILKEG